MTKASRSFLHRIRPLLPSLQALGCWCTCPRSSVAVVLGCVETLIGDASNDLRSRQGVLEPTAELAAHSWRLSPLCPKPGDLPHPCTLSKGGKWARECGAAAKTCGGGEAWCCGGIWLVRGHVPTGERPPGRLASHPLRGAAAAAPCPVPRRGAPAAALRVVRVRRLRGRGAGLGTGWRDVWWWRRAMGAD